MPTRTARELPIATVKAIHCHNTCLANTKANHFVEAGGDQLMGVRHVIGLAIAAYASQAPSIKLAGPF